jgi:tetratricopeptide (TPR) repeat protein
VQVGVQARADRYTYLPHIGLYIMLAWSAEKLMAGLAFRRWAWAAGVAVLIPALVLTTAAQTRNWKDNEALWASAIAANPETAIAHNNLGYVFQSKANENLAQSRLLQLQGKNAAAESLGRQSHDEMDKAFFHYQRAAEIRPRYVEAQVNLGTMYLNQQKWEDALQHFSVAVDVRPDYDLGYVRKGAALAALGKLDEAESTLRRALQLDPQYPETYWRLGEVLVREKKPEEAAKCYEVLLRDATLADNTRQILGDLYNSMHQPKKAIEYWTQYLNNHPDDVPVLTKMAWLLSTDTDPTVHDGPKALALAQRANAITKGRDPSVLMVLAAAMAENDNYSQAVEAVQKASAQSPNTPAPVFSPQEMIELSRAYQSGKRYYDQRARQFVPAPVPAGK